MAFLRNRTVNLINLHYTIHAFANSIGGIFILVFLLRQGVSVPGALLVIAAIFTLRFLIRPLTLALAKQWGLKPVAIIGTIALSAAYLVLGEVKGVDWVLVTYCFVTAIGETLYWGSYHAYFAYLGDHEHRGHQVSIREAAAAGVAIIGPLIGAWSLVTLGPRITFGAVFVIHALSALPLLYTPNFMIQASVSGAYRAAMPGIVLFFADGWLAVMYLFVWPIALYLTLSESLAAYGGAMALAALVGAITVMVLGRRIDAGFGRGFVLIAYGVVAVTVILRAASIDSAWLAVAANAIGAIATCLQPPAMMTAIYNLSKVSPCTLRYQIACEGGWDFGCAIGCLVAATMVAWGTPLSANIPLGLLGVIVSMYMLWRYYSATAVMAPSTA